MLALIELFLCRLALLLSKKEGLRYTNAVFRRDSRGGKVLSYMELKDSNKKLTREYNN